MISKVLVVLIWLESLCPNGLAYDENLQVSTFVLSGCKELLITKTNKFKMFPIKDLIHNSPRNNEIVRTQMYMAGFDMYTALTTSSKRPNYEEDSFYHSVINGYGRKKSQINMNNGEECYFRKENLTHQIYYTQLDLVLTKDGVMQYSNFRNPFYTCKLPVLNVTHIGFGSYHFEDDVRLFFDFPFHEECLSFYCFTKNECGIENV